MTTENIQGIVIRDMQPGEEAAVSQLVLRTFTEQVAGDFSEEGVRTFIAIVSPDALRVRFLF